MDSPAQKFRVFVRLRPVQPVPNPAVKPEDEEEEGGAPLPSARGENGQCSVEHRIIRLHDPAKGHSSEFVFDRVFGADTTQETVFNEVAKPLIQHVVQGYNGCCFAYGQTGSGKTYSMFGKEISVDPSTRGIIPLSVFEIFKVVEAAKAVGSTGRFSIYVSLLEIYLEQVRDLGRGVQASLESGHARRSSSTNGSGNSSARGRVSQSGVLPKGARQGPIQNGEDWTNTSLDVMEDPSGTTIIKDMTYIEVTDPAEVLAIVNTASQLRMTAATSQNDVSSRSHTVFTLSVVQHRDGRKPVTGRLHLVDLAGSERLGKSGSEGARLAETKAINKSLSSLGKVVMALTQGQGDRKADGEKPAHHVPYRDSKLTRILKNSLQGNCLTHMLAALNPAAVHVEECFNTLQFAVRCQSLDLAPRINPVNLDSSLPGAGPGNSDGGGEGNELAEQLAQQVAALQEELDLTHAHYQKMIEGIAGPNWTANLGPLERAAAEAAERRASIAGEHGSSVVKDEAAPLGGETGGGFAWSHEKGSKGQEHAFRRMEAALNAARAKQKEAEAALQRKKSDADDLRDRLAAKDQRQLAEIRRLRNRVADLTAQLHDLQVEEQGKVDKARLLLNEEITRLLNDNQVMRAQLDQVTTSVSSVMDRHTSQVSREAQNREAMRVGIERSMKQQIEAVEKERVKQVDNLKQQSAYFLEQKSQEVLSLKSQITQMHTQHEQEAKQLHAEVELLAAYAERVTEVLQKMESGVYGMVELAGVRALKLPPKDRPAGLDLERLQHLRQCGDVAQRLVELSQAAAAGPRPGSRPASSRISTSTNTRGGATFTGGMFAGPTRSAPVSAHPKVPAQDLPPHLLPVPTHGSLPLPLHGSSTVSSVTATAHAHHQQPHSPPQQQQHRQQEQAQAQGGEGSGHAGGDSGDEEQQALAEARAGAFQEPNSERTIQYMRSLEAALARQRAETLAERRKQGELTVALRAAQRVTARSPGNPLQAALLNTPLGPPPHWGYGHNFLNSSKGGAANGIARHMTRPVSAGPMRSGGNSSPPFFGSFARPFGSMMCATGLMQTGQCTGQDTGFGGGGWKSRPMTATGRTSAPPGPGYMVQR